MPIASNTSVSFEAIQYGKPVLCMEYLHACRSTVAHYLPETDMRSRDDLYETIAWLLHHGDAGFYSRRRRAHFIREIIGSENALHGYVDLLNEQIAPLAQSRRLAG